MANSPVPIRSELLAYVVGVALGDGNLSRLPRTVRLRISCDTRYPELFAHIRDSVQALLPNNRVCVVTQTSRCVDIVSHSNHWEVLLGWSASGGPKVAQGVSVPGWVFRSPNFMVNCLRGLIETDVSIYRDRGYIMVGFTSAIPKLADDVCTMMRSPGFRPRSCEGLSVPGPSARRAGCPTHAASRIYKVRLAHNVERFLELVNPTKA